MDVTGSELTFIFKNQTTRKFSTSATEATHMISSLVNPPQGGIYKPLSGELVPETYPFDFDAIFNKNYFWLKYFLSQRNFFALAKRPTYVNYEVLCNAFGTNVIDYSDAQIYKLNTDEMSNAELEQLLELHNEYSLENFTLRFQ